MVQNQARREEDITGELAKWEAEVREVGMPGVGGACEFPPQYKLTELKRIGIGRETYRIKGGRKQRWKQC